MTIDSAKDLQMKGSQNWSIGIDVLCIFTYTVIYRSTRTFTDHSSVITRCWGFELQNGKSSLKSLQTLAAQSFAPASFLSTHSKKHRKLGFRCFFVVKIRKR